jgi:hypothetical protein
MAERGTVTRQELHDEMKILRETLDRWRVQTQVQVDEMKVELHKHSKTIYGNGEPGLDEIARSNRAMIMNNATALEEVKKLVEDFRPVLVFYKVGVWFAGIIGVSVVALIWGIITHTVTLVRP